MSARRLREADSEAVSFARRMLGWGSLLCLGVAVVLPSAACYTPEECPATSTVELTPAQLVDLYPEKPCEIVITTGSRTMRVEMAVAACGASECDAACSSPDLQMGFSVCARGGQPGGFLIVATDSATGKTLVPFLGVNQRNPGASVTITCGGAQVWSGTRGVCSFPM